MKPFHWLVILKTLEFLTLTIILYIYIKRYFKVKKTYFNIDYLRFSLKLTKLLICAISKVYFL